MHSPGRESPGLEFSKGCHLIPPLRVFPHVFKYVRTCSHLFVHSSPFYKYFPNSPGDATTNKITVWIHDDPPEMPTCTSALLKRSASVATSTFGPTIAFGHATDFVSATVTNSYKPLPTVTIRPLPTQLNSIESRH